MFADSQSYSFSSFFLLLISIFAVRFMALSHFSEPRVAGGASLFFRHFFVGSRRVSCGPSQRLLFVVGPPPMSYPCHPCVGRQGGFSWRWRNFLKLALSGGCVIPSYSFFFVVRKIHVYNSEGLGTAEILLVLNNIRPFSNGGRAAGNIFLLSLKSLVTIPDGVCTLLCAWFVATSVGAAKPSTSLRGLG